MADPGRSDCHDTTTFTELFDAATGPCYSATLKPFGIAQSARHRGALVSARELLEQAARGEGAANEMAAAKARRPFARDKFVAPVRKRSAND